MATKGVRMNTGVSQKIYGREVGGDIIAAGLNMRASNLMHGCPQEHTKQLFL